MHDARKQLRRLMSLEQQENSSGIRTVAVDMVVERGVALGDGLELIVKVDDDLAQRQHEVELYPIARDILLVDELAALVETELDDGADIVGIGDDEALDLIFPTTTQSLENSAMLAVHRSQVHALIRHGLHHNTARRHQGFLVG